MKNLFTSVAVVVTAVSLIWHSSGIRSISAAKHVRHVVHAQSNKKGSSAYALVPNNNYTVPSSLGPADRFGEASQR